MFKLDDLIFADDIDNIVSGISSRYLTVDFKKKFFPNEGDNYSYLYSGFKYEGVQNTSDKIFLCFDNGHLFKCEFSN